MSKYRLLNTFCALSSCLAFSLSTYLSASAAELEGKIQKLDSDVSATANTATTSGKAIKPSSLLQGGIKDEATLHHSLKLLPGKPGTSQSLGGALQHVVVPLGSDMVRGPGGVYYAPGLPMPYVVPSVGARSGNIPPISSYTLVPQNSIIQVAPGFEYSSTAGINGAANYPSLYSSTPPVSVKGVTSYVSGWELPSVSRHEIPAVVTSTGSGIAVFQPGFEVGKVTGSAMSVVTASRTVNGITDFIPGSQVAFSSPGSGIICWAPGYEVSVQTPGLIKETLGGMWKAPSPPQLQATAGSFQNIRTYVEAVPPLMAKAMLLPGLRSDVSVNLNWNQWYQRVAKAIYSRWQTAAVGPGQATVRLTVTRDRQLSAQVTAFNPLGDASRNVESEKVFRESALKSANDVSMFEIPDFPAKSDTERVTFDVQMKRTVDGAAGYDVAAAH